MTDFHQLWNERRGAFAGGTTTAALRERALSRFAETGLPTPRSEDWKYTSLAPLRGLDLHAPGAPVPVSEPRGWHTTIDLPSPRLVVVDGRYDADASDLTGLPDGVRAGSLRDALQNDPAFVDERLATVASVDADALVALNTAFADDGALIVVPDGIVVDKPIHLVFATTQPGTANHPRNLVVLGTSAELKLVEQWFGPEGAYLANPVTEVLLGDNAGLTHTKLQQEGAGAFHLASVDVRQARDSRYRAHSFAFGGRIGRTRVAVRLGEGAETELVGLYLAGRDQIHDHHTLVDHAEPNARSDERFKGILDAGGRGVFTGKVHVAKDAQHTDASQNVRNLLLADDAIANARPQLEINADDVKCAHGAAIGRLDEEALFFLRARGIPLDEARRLLTFAFASEIVATVKDDALRHTIEGLVHHWLRRLGEAS